MCVSFSLCWSALINVALQGGFIEFLPGTEAAFIAATANFSTNNTDPKAAIIASFTSVGGLSVLGGLSFFYDAPQAPAGTFDAFLSIPAILKDVKTRSLTSLVQSTPSNMTISRCVLVKRTAKNTS
jgi:hypothetical protein